MKGKRGRPLRQLSELGIDYFKLDYRYTGAIAGANDAAWPTPLVENASGEQPAEVEVHALADEDWNPLERCLGLVPFAPLNRSLAASAFAQLGDDLLGAVALLGHV